MGEELVKYSKLWSIGDPNKSQIFILPLLGGKCKDYASLTSMPQIQFRNCFIGDKSNNIKDKILLLYRFSADKLYLGFETELETHELFDCRYEVDKSHTMFVFNVPNSKIIDYHKIIEGKYSEVSNDLKLSILMFHGIKGESNVGGVLYKTQARKDLMEKRINEGLPKIQWCKIDDKTELESVFDEEIEYMWEKYKIKSAIASFNG